MKIAAFFDLDGTLIPPPSLERRFLRFLAGRRHFGIMNLARWLARFLWRVPFNFYAAVDGNKAHLAGVAVNALSDWNDWLSCHPVQFLPEALDRLAWHQSQGHDIFFVSGTLEPLARVFLERSLSFPVSLCASRPEFRGGCWTGRIVGEAVCGPAKARVLRQLAECHCIDLARSFAYGDRFVDRSMLEAVGHPAAVNPSRALRCLARLRNWPILEWCVPSYSAPPAVRTLPRREEQKCRVSCL